MKTKKSRKQQSQAKTHSLSIILLDSKEFDTNKVLDFSKYVINHTKNLNLKINIVTNEKLAFDKISDIQESELSFYSLGEINEDNLNFYTSDNKVIILNELGSNEEHYLDTILKYAYNTKKSLKASIFLH